MSRLRAWSTSSCVPSLIAAGLLVLAATAAPLRSQETDVDDQEPISYVRALDGHATVSPSTSGVSEDLEARYPILGGDRLRVDAGGRVDALLADGSQLAIQGRAELVVGEVLPPTDDAPAELRATLLEGQMLLDSHDLWGEDPNILIDTQNARIYLHQDGRYEIGAERFGYSSVATQRGFAEVVSDAGSSVVRAGESLVVEGDTAPNVHLSALGPQSPLDVWASSQEQADSRASDGALDHPLPGTATLSDYGDWVQTADGRAWRPVSVGADWQPYDNGRWAETPAGYYWVAYDPWSPVTFHYGSWSWNASFGWLWYPGWAFAPAHVTWYWGPEYVAWVPSAYYGHRFGRGIYGTFTADVHHLLDWLFCPISHFGHRHSHSYYRHGRDLAYLGRLERGILTSDTRHFVGRDWRRPETVRRAIERGWRPSGASENLPDLSDVFDRRANRRELRPIAEDRGPTRDRRFRDREAVERRARERDPASGVHAPRSPREGEHGRGSFVRRSPRPSPQGTSAAGAKPRRAVPEDSPAPTARRRIQVERERPSPSAHTTAAPRERARTGVARTTREQPRGAEPRAVQPRARTRSNGGDRNDDYRRLEARRPLRQPDQPRAVQRERRPSSRSAPDSPRSRYAQRPGRERQATPSRRPAGSSSQPRASTGTDRGSSRGDHRVDRGSGRRSSGARASSHAASDTRRSSPRHSRRRDD